MTFCQIIQADAGRIPLADKSVDLVFGSPPYCDARTYGIGAQRDCVEWVDWMLAVTKECQRVSRGPVVWVAAGVTRERNYWPACEGLMWEWWKLGNECQLYRPVYWHRVGIPGSGGKDWFRADVEYCMCFKRPGPLPWSDNTAMGHPPKWAPGGAMSHRLSGGARVNQWGHSIATGATTGPKDDITSQGMRPSHRLAKRDKWGGTVHATGGEGRNADGSRKSRNRFPTRKNQDGIHGEKRVGAPRYEGVAIANPGNLVRVKVGGGLMGSKLAHENEAPFPEKLAEWFVRSLCPQGGIVYDPFSGSGTTAKVARAWGRSAIASDIRASQCDLTRRRVNEVQLMMAV